MAKSQPPEEGVLSWY